VVLSGILVQGYGAVSPAGWGVNALRWALTHNDPVPAREIARAGSHPVHARRVPPPPTRPAFVRHARLRRTSPIAHYAVAAALEALGSHAGPANPAAGRLGIIFCSMTGCVNHSQRFYDETLKDPATASPLVFPETVFNAPASHLAALLNTSAINYTLVGDPGTFLQGLALAADWLVQERVDGCVVVGAEEFDWLIAEALQLFSRQSTVAEGAGAIYLRRQNGTAAGLELGAITQPHLFWTSSSRQRAANAARAQLGTPPAHSVLCDGLQGVPQLDRNESTAWQDWLGDRISPKKILGEGFMAAAAWQCVTAVDALSLNGYAAADVSIVGCNQQVIAARFVKNA
jgi:3-oxoacyl-(acyl-carrier-protein) synthase